MARNLSSLFQLREDVTFLNHGSFGACPLPVFDAYQAIQREIERQPVAFLARELTERMHGPRMALAAELGTAPGNIAGAMSNVTYGLNTVARSLDLREGDEIITSDHEYGALEKTWAFVARKTGAKVVQAKVPMPLVSEAAFFDAFTAAMTPRTRVLFLSHITSPTALYFPVERLVAEAKRRGIFTIIDGAHAPGHVPLDLDTLDADFYSGTCHKWLMSPKGAAFLYTRPSMQTLVDPLVVSHGWTAESKQPGAVGLFGNSPFIDENEFMGTRDSSAWLAIPALLDFRREHGWAGVMQDCSDLAWETGQRVSRLTGLQPLASREHTAPQMVAMPVPRVDDPPAFQQRLMDLYGIEIPVLNWGPHSIVRVSIQGYNSAEQADLLVRAIKEQFAL